MSFIKEELDSQFDLHERFEEIHIRIQPRNGRKNITLIEGLPEKEIF